MRNNVPVEVQLKLSNVINRINVIRQQMQNMVRKDQKGAYTNLEIELSQLTTTYERTYAMLEVPHHDVFESCGQSDINHNNADIEIKLHARNPFINQPYMQQAQYIPQAPTYVHRPPVLSPVTGSEFPYMLATGLIEGKVQLDDKFTYKIIGEESYTDLDYGVANIYDIPKVIPYTDEMLFRAGLTDEPIVLGGLFKRTHGAVEAFDGVPYPTNVKAFKDLYERCKNYNTYEDYVTALTEVAEFITADLNLVTLNNLDSYLTSRLNTLFAYETTQTETIDSFAGDFYNLVTLLEERITLPSEKNEFSHVIKTLYKECMFILEHIKLSKHVSGDGVNSMKYFHIEMSYYINVMFLSSEAFKLELKPLDYNQPRYVTAKSHKWLFDQLTKYTEDLTNPESKTLLKDCVPGIICIVDNNHSVTRITINKFRDKYIISKIQ